MKKYMLERFQEPSTIRGIIWVLGAFGIYAMGEEQANAVTYLTMALAGASGMVTPDRFPKHK
jgi:predicted anti-sigma-YlaC factor YlaD